MEETILIKGGESNSNRSTLSNLPIYFMSLLRLPSSVRRRLEQIQRDFLWGGGNLEQKPHLVRWKVVCLSKRKGDWGSNVFPFSIRLFFPNGIGDLQMREMLCGIK